MFVAFCFYRFTNFSTSTKKISSYLVSGIVPTKCINENSVVNVFCWCWVFQRRYSSVWNARLVLCRETSRMSNWELPLSPHSSVSRCRKAAYEICLRSEGWRATNGFMRPPDCVHFRASQAHPLPTGQLMQLHPCICRGLPQSSFPPQLTAPLVTLCVDEEVCVYRCVSVWCRGRGRSWDW